MSFPIPLSKGSDSHSNFHIGHDNDELMPMNNIIQNSTFPLILSYLILQDVHIATSTFHFQIEQITTKHISNIHQSHHVHLLSQFKPPPLRWNLSFFLSQTPTSHCWLLELLQSSYRPTKLSIKLQVRTSPLSHNGGVRNA